MACPVCSKRHHARPLSLSAELAGLTRDAVFQLSGAGLEADAVRIDPGPAGIIRGHHANGRKPVTMAPAGLFFRITGKVDREPGLIAPRHGVQIIQRLNVVGVRERP